MLPVALTSSDQLLPTMRGLAHNTTKRDTSSLSLFFQGTAVHSSACHRYNYKMKTFASFITRDQELNSVDRATRERYRLWQVVVRFLLRVRKGKKRSICEKDFAAVSPGTTALMGGEDCSIDMGQSGFLVDSDDDSVYAVAPEPSTDIYYAPPTFAGDDKTQDSDDFSDGNDIKLLYRWRERMGRSWKRLSKGRENEFLLAMEANNSNTEEDEDDTDLWSQHFSISTNREVSAYQRTSEPRQASITVPAATDDSDDYTDEDDKTRMSLGDFFENRPSLEQGLYPSAVHLGDITAQDSGSTGSAHLAVSYDDDCAQLVLKRLSSFESEVDILLNEIPLGALYPHPAGNSISSASTTVSKDKVASCVSSWLDNNDKFWKEFDAETVDETLDSQYSAPPSPTVIETKSTDWDGDNLGWSCSQDDSVVSFTSMLDDSVFKPIYHLATDMPVLPNLCGVSDDPFDEDSLDLDSGTTSFRRPHPRFSHKV